MHICFVNMPIEFYSPTSGGAVATVTMQLARQMLARGHRVTVLTPLDTNPTYEFGEVVGVRSATTEKVGLLTRAIEKVRTRHQRWDWPQFGIFARSVVETLRRLPAPDAVITHNDFVLPHLLRAAVPRSRLLVYLHNEWRSRFRSIQASLSAVHHFVSVSDYVRDWTMRHWQIRGDRISTILNGVDTEQFSPAPWFPQRPWRELRVLYVGRLDPSKGVDLAVDAVRRLRAEGRDVRFTFAGPVWWHGVHTESDPYYRQLKAATDAVGGRYLGRLDRADVPGVMREHDVVCVLSRTEDPCPLVLGEAMACGCAVVASRRGGIPEACGGAAALIEPDDSDQTAAALRRFVEDPDALPAARVRALARGRSLSWARQAQAVERIIAD